MSAEDTFAEAWPQDHEQDHDPWWEDFGETTRCTRCGLVGVEGNPK